jgi:Cu2+-exporting ATPase
LATPTALAAARQALLRHGIQNATGDALETLARADAVVFDKTATLTAGRPGGVDVRLNAERDGWTDQRALQVASALEADSLHPVAHAFRSPGSLLQAEAVRTHPHAGMSGQVAGVAYTLGRPGFAAAPDAAVDAGDAGIWLGDVQGWIARFEIDDRLRQGAAETLDSLAERGMTRVIASGDAAVPVERVARRLGVGRWKAGMSAEAKMHLLQGLQREGHIVVAVGDGVNDAPVLAAADVSISVQGAADLANSTSDLVCTRVALSGVLVAIDTARRTRQIIRQNLAWAVAYNLLAIPLAASGVMAPWMAALGMSTSSLLVVLNAARLARKPAKSFETAAGVHAEAAA